MAAEGSIPAAARAERWERSIASGVARVGFRPKNSVRSHVKVLDRSFTSKNAIRLENSVLYGLRAKSAPVSGSISVVTCIIDLGRRSASTNSTYPVRESRRDRPESVRTLYAAYLIDASTE